MESVLTFVESVLSLLLSDPCPRGYAFTSSVPIHLIGSDSFHEYPRTNGFMIPIRPSIRIIRKIFQG